MFKISFELVDILHRLSCIQNRSKYCCPMISRAMEQEYVLGYGHPALRKTD